METELLSKIIRADTRIVVTNSKVERIPEYDPWIPEYMVPFKDRENLLIHGYWLESAHMDAAFGETKEVISFSINSNNLLPT